MDKFIEALGEPTNRGCKDMTFPCPLCREEGEDKSGDNLKILLKTKLLTCFKSRIHTMELRKNYKGLRGKEKAKPETVKMEFNIPKEKEMKKYLSACQAQLHDHYNSFIEHRGLRVSTLKELNVGVDPKKPCWVFPVFHYPSNHLIGFEYRDIEMLPRKQGGKIWHEPGTFSCLCQIERKTIRDIRSIVVMEGFIDCYTAYQMTKDKYGCCPHLFITASCGVNSIVKHWNQIKWLNNTVELFLDNDKAGIEARKEILLKSKFVFYEGYVEDGHNDFGEYYMKEVIK